MKISEIMENSSAPTTAGNIAVVANPIQAHQKLKKDKNGIPVAPQKKKGKLAVNALDVDDNVMGSVVKR